MTQHDSWLQLSRRALLGRPDASGASRRAIEDLIIAYAWLIDTGDFAGVGALLGAGIVTGGGPPMTGAAAIEQFYRDTLILYEDGTPKTRHIVSNILVDVDDEAGTAIARSSFTALQAVSGLSLQPIAAGRYDDRFERRDGKWCFVERRMHTELVGDLTHHLQPAVLRRISWPG
ncbi:aromatic-ring-hydroxylating dioxygenase [Cystobacter fuscus]|uniref:Aromatic-ring-hydroxylating dioxygenase n=1 Tax=Cystobacter fuscus TaxID=43 RepID=A0A250IW47_9BACT|nr:nuclear transport factor 2 family protein [Cystobacter fuscus]ATB35959.1 aromatic-ring-hydroxylating dioxygenase [Cystobacter fuscus]